MNIVIVLEDGVIKDIITDKEECNVLVVNRDINLFEGYKTCDIEEKNSVVIEEKPDVNPERVKDIYSAAGKKFKEEKKSDYQKSLIRCEIEEYISEEEIGLTEEQKQLVVDDMIGWLDGSLREYVAGSIEAGEYTYTFNPSFIKMTIDEFNEEYSLNLTKEMSKKEIIDYLKEFDSWFYVSYNLEDILGAVKDKWGPDRTLRTLDILYLNVEGLYMAVY